MVFEGNTVTWKNAYDKMFKKEKSKIKFYE